MLSSSCVERRLILRNELPPCISRTSPTGCPGISSAILSSWEQAKLCYLGISFRFLAHTSNRAAFHLQKAGSKLSVTVCLKGTAVAPR